MDAIKKYFEEGGSVYIALGEGGCEKNNTNLNFLLEDYGVSFNTDSVVRTSYSKYLHPKECYIEEGKFHSEFAKTIKTVGGKKRKVMTNDDLLDQVNETNTTDDIDDGKIKVVYPYGCSLNIKSNKISVVFGSGTISYPLKRPLMVAITSNSKKGRMIVVGSEKLIEDEFLEAEDNKKIMVSFKYS
jgi:intraflagellar transport protein 52